MPIVNDFRTYAFDPKRVDAAGKHLSKRTYWKLYAVENLVRIVVHSVLTIQAGQNWWDIAVGTNIKKRTSRFMNDYSNRPWHSSPGMHPIYYTLLSDLNKIITENSHLFIPIVPDIDAWIAKIEQVRLPRNIVGHMNWLTETDSKRIDVCHADLQALVTHLKDTGKNLNIP